MAHENHFASKLLKCHRLADICLGFSVDLVWTAQLVEVLVYDQYLGNKSLNAGPFPTLFCYYQPVLVVNMKMENSIS